MKRLAVIALGCLAGLQTSAQVESKLAAEIRSWHKGDAPPARLLKFPDGKIGEIPGCGIRGFGTEVSDYVSEIEDADLLVALIFDSRAQAETVHAAASRLIRLRGVAEVSHILAERRKADPRVFARPELAVLFQLLQAPYITVQVARIAAEDMQPAKAMSALRAMQAELQSGATWEKAYGKHSDLHPDRRHGAEDEGAIQTLVGFLYDSTVSRSGFDIVTYTTVEGLPPEHLRELFRVKRGTHIFRAADGIYLYHVQSYYAGAS